MEPKGISDLKNWVINSRLMKRLSSGYIVGPDISDAINACKIAAENGWSTSVAPWHYPSDSGEVVFSNYMTALESIINEDLDSYLSIKVWAFKYDFGFFKDILELAKGANVRVHFDSLDIESAIPTFALLEKGLSIYQNISYTLPGRWERSITDAERIIDFGIPVRVVKGESVDDVNPNMNLRDGFLNIINILAGRAAHVDVATHDTILAKKSLMRLRETETSCHLEQLYGIPLRSVSVAEKLCLPIRIYIPYGNSMVGYGLKKIAKRPIVLTWMIRDLLLGDKFRLPRAKG